MANETPNQEEDMTTLPRRRRRPPSPNADAALATSPAPARSRRRRGPRPIEDLTMTPEQMETGRQEITRLKEKKKKQHTIKTK